MMPTLRQLEYAVAVADHLHFGRAARACNVSQPALSAQIQRLEKGLGVRIFERSRRGVTVTAVGSTLVRRARGILREIADLVESARIVPGPLGGDLRLGSIRTLGPYLLPRALGELRNGYPGIRLLIEEGRDDELAERLVDGRLDLLLTSLPVTGDGLESMQLFRERLVVVLPADHPLIEREALEVHDLAGQRVLVLEEGHRLRDQVRGICREAGAETVGEVRGASLLALVQMAASGIGIAVVPALAAAVEAPAEIGAAVRPFRRPGPGREVGLVWRRASPRREEYRRLATLFRPK